MVERGAVDRVCRGANGRPLACRNLHARDAKVGLLQSDVLKVGVAVDVELYGAGDISQSAHLNRGCSLGYILNGKLAVGINGIL